MVVCYHMIFDLHFASWVIQNSSLTRLLLQNEMSQVKFSGNFMLITDIDLLLLANHIDVFWGHLFWSENTTGAMSLVCFICAITWELFYFSKITINQELLSFFTHTLPVPSSVPLMHFIYISFTCDLHFSLLCFMLFNT